MKIENEIITLFAENLDIPVEDAALELEIKNILGPDSFDFAELLVLFEEKFDIDINEQDAEKIITVQDAIDYIKKTVR